MPESPLRRKPATELEAKVGAGQDFALDELLDVIDQPMSDELIAVFKSALTKDERDDLARDVLVELANDPTKYDHARGSLVRYAKMRVRTLAIDYLNDRKKARGQQTLFEERGYLKLVIDDPASPAMAIEDRRRMDELADRVRIALVALPQEQQRAAGAYVKYGPSCFAAKLAKELGVKANRVSQWWTRAKRAIRDAIGPDVEVSE